MTGILLVLAPAFTLRLMQISVAGESLAYVRFIGAFVLAVGSLYLWGLALAGLTGRWSAVASALWTTSWVRSVICVFGIAAVLSGQLSVRWITVPVTDGVVAIIQLAWLLSGGVPRDE